MIGIKFPDFGILWIMTITFPVPPGTDHSAGEPGSRGYVLAPHGSRPQRPVPVGNGQLHSARFARSVPLAVSDGNWPFRTGTMLRSAISPGTLYSHLDLPEEGHGSLLAMIRLKDLGPRPSEDP